MNNKSNNGSLSPKCNIIVNTNQLKNDTYESVCSPEDTAERTKVAQRHSIAVNGNGNGIAPTAIANNSNGTMPSIGSANNNANMAIDNRALKRVISAPVAVNDIKGS